MASSWIVTDTNPAMRPMAVPWYWRSFIERHRLPPLGMTRPDLASLRQIVRCFASVPYENASELIWFAERGAEPRLPARMIGEHLRIGTGGTCYALTYALRDLLVLYGFEPRLHLGRAGSARPQRPFVPNHVALGIELDEGRYLVDPGMVLHEPLAIGNTSVIIPNRGARESTVLTQVDEHGFVRQCFTTSSGFRQMCFVHLAPISEDAYMTAWRASFDPLLPAEFLFLNRFDGEIFWTVEDRFLTRRDGHGESRRLIHFDEIAARWGLVEETVRQAWLCTPHSRPSARIRGTIRRRLCSMLDDARRKIDHFP